MQKETMLVKFRFFVVLAGALVIFSGGAANYIVSQTEEVKNAPFLQDFASTLIFFKPKPEKLDCGGPSK